MALSLAAAALGSAALGLGSAALGADQQKDAARATDRANQEAAAKSLAAQQQAQATVRDVQNPYLATGGAANTAVADRLGLGGQPAAGSPDYAALVNNNAPLAELWADPNAQAAWGGDLAAFGKAYADSGGAAANGWEVPTVQGDPAAPKPWSPPTNFGTAPTAPGFTAIPGAADISEQAFQSSPLFNLGLSEGQANLNTNFGARGLLRSGAAIKGALDFARENVKNNYSTFASTALQNNAQAQNAAIATNAGQQNLFSTTANQFNNDRNFDYGQYTDGLNYTSNRYDTDTNNLFRLAGSGQAAANTVSNAATGFADRASDIYGGQAASTGGRAAAVADANAGLVGNIAGIGQNLFRTAGNSSGGRTTPLSSVNPYGFGADYTPAGYQSNVPGLRQPQAVF